MRFDYTFYTTDESFDYGDIFTHHQTGYHGFSIDVDDEGFISIDTLDAYGDYTEMNDIKSLEELKTYIQEHLDEVEEPDEKERFEYLIENINKSMETKYEAA